MRSTSPGAALAISSGSPPRRQVQGASPATGTAALVELYTSEGCSSCPPADRWLSGLAGSGHAPERVVPLALHVDYWDYIGWKDPYAKREFSQRQRKLTPAAAHGARLHAAGACCRGEDFRALGLAGVRRRRGADQRPAGEGAHRARDPRRRAGRARGRRRRAELVDPAPPATPALYLAAYENRLSSRVTAGREPRPHAGARLRRAASGRGPSPSAGGQATRSGARSPLLPRAAPERLRGGRLRAGPAHRRGAPGLCSGLPGLTWL